MSKEILKDTNHINNINNQCKKENKTESKEFLKVKYFKTIVKFYEDLNKKVVKNINKVNKLKNKSFQNIIIDNDEKIMIITNKIIEIYQSFLLNFQKLFENIITKLNNYLSNYNQLQIKIEDYEEINKIIRQKNKKIKELKDNYHQNGIELEKILINHKEIEINLEEVDKILSKTKESLNKYKIEVNEINKYKNQYNEKQIDLVENYTKFNKIFLYDNIKKDINTNMEKFLKIISQNILDLNTSKKLNPKKSIDDFKNNKFNKINLLENEKIIHFPSSIDFEGISKEKDYAIITNAISFIKSSIDDETLYSNFDRQKEKKNFEIRKILIPFFDIIKYPNFEITDENKFKVLNIVKEPSNHNLFILTMSKYRGKNERSKEWIELMGECLNIILDISLKNNDYDNIKHCMILSQTYYYNDDKNKIYLTIKVENKDFWNDQHFWQKFIDFNIIRELKSYQQANNLIGMDLITGEGVTVNIIKQLGNLLFTQLLPFTNNMIEFNLDKEKIKNVVDYFKAKYNYLKKNDYESILSILNK